MKGNQVKMLQILIDGQAELKKQIANTEKSLRTEIKKVDKKLSSRIDKLGKSLAYLEDDAPTIEEFDELKTDVKKLKKRVFSN